MPPTSQAQSPSGPGTPESIESRSITRLTVTRSRDRARHGSPPPTTDWDLLQRVQSDLAWVSRNSEAYQRLSGMWAMLDSSAKLIAALTASLSVLTYFADRGTWSVVFSVVTAVVTALNVALNPGDRAAAHRRTSKDYRHLQRPIANILTAIEGKTGTVYEEAPACDLGTGQVRDQGHFSRLALSADDLGLYWAQFSPYQERIEEIDENSPDLNRWLSGTSEPRSAIGVALLKRRLRHARQAHEALCDHYRSESEMEARSMMGQGLLP